MYEASDLPPEQDDEIARHEVSEDGLTWRPYDPRRDNGRALLHQRIVFAPPTEPPSPR